MNEESHSRYVPEGHTRDCLDPWVYVEFRIDGGVGPCCVRKSVGDYRTTELGAILNGPAIRQLRISLLTGELDRICGGCGLKGPIPVAKLQTKVAELLDAVKLPPGFTDEDYLQANPDVAATGANAADHFLEHGRMEGRAVRR